MAGDDDDIAALFAQNVDRIVIKGSFVSKVKSGHADLNALDLIYIVITVVAPDDPRIFQDLSGLQVTFLGIVEHVVISKVTALDASEF